MPETGSASTAAEAAANPGNVPELRREFVGIMFALAVGEVGLQTAALVQAGHFTRYLPAYSHLFLALFVIAASWVGWSRTKVASARKDVHELFEWAFLVLLLDTAMVVTYFILVRTVDFSDGNCRIDPASKVAFWHIVIFFLYLLWDGVTKVGMYPKPKGARWWSGWTLLKAKERREQYQTMKRAWPTLVCFGLSIVLWGVFAAFDPKQEHLLAADLALLSVVLLFRALKGVVPGPKQTTENIAWNWKWVVGLCVTLLIGTSLSVYSLPWPLWPSLHDIRTPIACSSASAVSN